MADTEAGWAVIIKAVRTPLGFFSLLVLVVDAVLAVAAPGQLPWGVPAGLLALLIVSVFLIAFFRPKALYHPSDWPKPRNLTVTLVFPVDPFGVDLDTDKGVLDIRDKRGKPRHRVRPNLVFGHGGWVFELPDDLEPSDSIRLQLWENTGAGWKTNPFAPYQTETKMIQVQPPG